MQIKNIIRSALALDDLSIIFIGQEYLIPATLNMHKKINIYSATDLSPDLPVYNGQEAYDMILAMAPISNIYQNIFLTERVPSFFLATEPPFKKEFGWMVKHRMGFNEILAPTEELLRSFYEKNNNIFNITNLESCYECLNKLLRAAKSVVSQNTEMIHNMDAQPAS